MNKMIKMAIMVAGTAAMLGIVGCGESADSPEAIAKQAVVGEAARNGMAIEAKVAESEIKDDKATVIVDGYFNGQKIATEKVGLIKKDGKWVTVELDGKKVK